MRKLMKLFLLAAALVIGATTMTGCRTAEGFGHDLENTGEAIQNSTQ